MKESAGIIIRLSGSKLLLCRPSNKELRLKSGSVNKLWGPPKGGIDSGETKLEAAIRETREEIGLKIKKDQIKNSNKPITISYVNKGGSVYKKVYLFLVDIDSTTQIGLGSEEVPENFLQIEEIDKAYFMDKSEATDKIFHRFKSLLDLI
jgi:8-oxo-dGTP pyrophosphatase MutT (NUDIX family)